MGAPHIVLASPQCAPVMYKYNFSQLLHSHCCSTRTRQRDEFENSEPARARDKTPCIIHAGRITLAARAVPPRPACALRPEPHHFSSPSTGLPTKHITSPIHLHTMYNTPRCIPLAESRARGGHFAATRSRTRVPRPHSRHRQSHASAQSG